MSIEEPELDLIASETAFSGVVRVDRGDRVEISKAYGLAHRGYGIANEVDTRFALASGTKGLTALTVVSLVEDGTLALTTTARSVLDKDLPLVTDEVTVEQLLAHRSGIGDYLDEEAGLDLDDYLMPVPVHELVTTEDFLAVLDGHPPKFAPGDRFAYCNGGYVVLALIAERAIGTPFHDLVQSRSASARGCPTPRSCARTSSRPVRLAATSRATTRRERTSSICPSEDRVTAGIYSTAADIRSSGRRSSAERSCRTTGSRRWSALAAMPVQGEAVRPRLLVAPVHRRRAAHWDGCRSLFQLDARAAIECHAHRDLEHLARNLAGRALPRRPADALERGAVDRPRRVRSRRSRTGGSSRCRGSRRSG